SGNMRVSASPAQDAKVALRVDEARRLGRPGTAQPLTPEEGAARCKSPVVRGGVSLPEGANLHPGRMGRALRQAVIESGVSVFEYTPMIGLDRGATNRIRTPGGEIVARDVVLATNVHLAAMPDVHPFLTVFSSYALMTEPAPERLVSTGWSGDEGIADLRMFVHYFRKTPDGRVLMGSGSGPISYGGDASSSRLREDAASAARAESGLKRLLPQLGTVT